MKKTALVAVCASVALTAVAAFARCNYTPDQIQAQLPFKPVKMKILEQEPVSSDVCSVITRVQFPNGVRYIPFFVVKGKGVIIGSLFSRKSNITANRIAAIRSAEVKKAFTSVRAELKKAAIAEYKPANYNGKHIYAFVDPLCPFCARLESKMKEISDKTGYAFVLIPFIVHGVPAKKDVERFVCKHKSFDDFVAHRFGKGDVSCKEADQKIKLGMKLGEKLGVGGTPTVFFEDGRSVVGANIGKIEEYASSGSTAKK